MSIEAHRCNVPGCKGFIVFENADFDIINPPIVNGMYEFDNPTCTECKKEFKVVPHYAVIAIDEEGDIENDIKSCCITEYERREKEITCKKCGRIDSVQADTKIYKSSLCKVCFEEEFKIAYFRDYKHG